MESDEEVIVYDIPQYKGLVLRWSASLQMTSKCYWGEQSKNPEITADKSRSNCQLVTWFWKTTFILNYFDGQQNIRYFSVSCNYPNSLVETFDSSFLCPASEVIIWLQHILDYLDYGDLQKLIISKDKYVEWIESFTSAYSHMHVVYTVHWKW